jgi:hypothetical protein
MSKTTNKATAMGATYAKLQSGEWGVRTTGLKVSPGLVLTVEKRDGTRKEETVARVVWQRGDVAICAIEPGPSPKKAAPARRYGRHEPGFYSDGDDGCGGDW